MRLAWLAVAALVASAVSSLIHWQMIVPQLPELSLMPRMWVALQPLPVVLVVILAGYQARSISRVLASAAAIVLPWVVVETAYGLITGRPVAHDLWATDAAYWQIVIGQIVVCAVIVGVLAFAFEPLRRLAAKVKGADP